jgi:hypothetical protein
MGPAAAFADCPRTTSGLSIRLPVLCLHQRHYTGSSALPRHCGGGGIRTLDLRIMSPAGTAELPYSAPKHKRGLRAVSIPGQDFPAAKDIRLCRVGLPRRYVLDHRPRREAQRCARRMRDSNPRGCYPSWLATRRNRPAMRILQGLASVGTRRGASTRGWPPERSHPRTHPLPVGGEGGSDTAERRRTAAPEPG